MPHANKVTVKAHAKTVIDQRDHKSAGRIIAEDRKRDSRNAERRKIIKRQTYPRRNSLADSLLIAKAVIDGYAQNKNFEKKAKERRRVISQCCSDQKERRMSFADDLKMACEVVAPKWNQKQRLEKSKEKCRSIKEKFSGKRRPSLLEEIEVARDVIVDSERRERALPPEVVQEVG